MLLPPFSLRRLITLCEVPLHKYHAVNPVVRVTMTKSGHLCNGINIYQKIRSSGKNLNFFVGEKQPLYRRVAVELGHPIARNALQLWL